MHAIPADFSDRIRVQFPSEADAFLKALDRSPAASVRLNPSKPGVRFDDAVPVLWNKDGFILASRPRFTMDPKLHAGCYYPQESSSMVLQWVLQHTVKLDSRVDAVDLCAAPGGKTLIISDFLKSQGRLISNEIVRSRAHILNEVVVKWGCTNVAVTNNRPADFSEAGMQFDLMVVDAPCSGEGMFRKDPDARNEWNAGSAVMCSKRQTEILSEIIPALRENGILIYSTCTFAKEENEDIIQALLDTGEFETVRWPVPPEWNISILDERGMYAMRFLPHRAPGEGFFIAALRKVSSASAKRSKPKNVFSSCNSEGKGVLQKRGIDAEGTVLAPDGELYHSVFTQKELNTMAGSLYFISPGIHLGKVLRGELLPGHALALANIEWLQDNTVELNETQALAYLRGESLAIEASNGWHRVAFQSHPLGWIKAIGKRVNNYYPKEWRVKLKE